VPSGVPSFTNPATIASAQEPPKMSPLTTPRPITADAQGTSNSLRASGADLITRTFNLIDTSSINGLGGRVDLIA